MARWEKTARWAITDLKGDSLIRSLERNRWVITEKGRNVLLKQYEKPSGTVAISVHEPGPIEKWAEGIG